MCLDQWRCVLCNHSYKAGPCIRVSTQRPWTSLTIGSTKRVRSDHVSYHSVFAMWYEHAPVQELLVEQDTEGELHCGSTQPRCLDNQMATSVHRRSRRVQKDNKVLPTGRGGGLIGSPGGFSPCRDPISGLRVQGIRRGVCDVQSKVHTEATLGTVHGPRKGLGPRGRDCATVAVSTAGAVEHRV